MLSVLVVPSNENIIQHIDLRLTIHMSLHMLEDVPLSEKRLIKYNRQRINSSLSYPSFVNIKRCILHILHSSCRSVGIDLTF